MKKVFLGLFAMMMTTLVPMSAFGVTIVQQDFETGGVPGAWNWTGGAATTNSASIVDYEGSKWRQMQSSVNAGSGATGRYGYKMDIAVTGNTSANPEDYFVEFDIVNLEGDWTTVNIGIAILTNTGGDNGTTSVGYGFPNTAVTREAGIVHVKWQLSEHTSNWWQGTNWDLTAPNWSYEINMPDTAVATGATFTQKILIDNFRIVLGSDQEPYDPVVLPENVGGTSGTLMENEEVEVTLGWMAGADPDINRAYPVNPDIFGHYIMFSTGAPSDPNLYYYDFVEQVFNTTTPEETDPYNEFGPLYLDPSTEYSWQIIEAMNYGAGTYSAIDDPNSIVGPVWTFTTVGVAPVIATQPDHALVDADSNASFTVVANSVATDYRWFKVGTAGDTKLADGGVFSGTQTATLTVTGATSADEGKYYCIAYNGDPDNGGIPSEPSKSVWLWLPHITSRFEFETLVNNETTDGIGGFVATMNSVVAEGGTAVTAPSVVAGVPELGGNALSFGGNTGTSSTTGNFATMTPGVVDYKDITISAWVYWNGGNAWQRIIDCGSDTNNYIFLSPGNGNNGGSCVFAVKRNGSESSINTPALPIGAWTYVTATLSGNTARLYVNGEFKSSGNIPYNPVDIASVNNYLGDSQWSGDPFFNGIIDDLRVYNYARTTEQIAKDYLVIKGETVEFVCDMENYDLVFDFDDNCQVDIEDFADFAATWMDSYRIYPIEQ